MSRGDLKFLHIKKSLPNDFLENFPSICLLLSVLFFFVNIVEAMHKMLISKCS